MFQMTIYTGYQATFNTMRTAHDTIETPQS